MELPQQLARTLARGREQDPPLGVRDVLEKNIEPVRRKSRARAVGPLDHGDAASVERLLPAGGPQVLALEPVEVEMEQRHPTAVVLVEDDEGRARDVARFEAKPRGHPLRADRLAGAKLSPERE